MSSPWTSPDPTQYDLGHADAVPPQNGQAAQAPQPAYPGPAGVAAPQPAYAAPDTPGNSAPTASGYSQASTWSWAPKPGIIPLRPLTLTDLFSGSFSALRKNPSVLVGFTIIVMTVMALLSLAGTMLPLFSFTSLMSNDLDPQASSKALLDSAYMSVVSTIVGYIAILAGSFLAGILLDGVLSVGLAPLDARGRESPAGLGHLVLHVAVQWPRLGCILQFVWPVACSGGSRGLGELRHQYPLPVRTDLRCAGGEGTHRGR